MKITNRVIKIKIPLGFVRRGLLLSKKAAEVTIEEMFAVHKVSPKLIRFYRGLYYKDDLSRDTRTGVFVLDLSLKNIIKSLRRDIRMVA